MVTIGGRRLDQDGGRADLTHLAPHEDATRWMVRSGELEEARCEGSKPGEWRRSEVACDGSQYQSRRLIVHRGEGTRRWSPGKLCSMRKGTPTPAYRSRRRRRQFVTSTLDTYRGDGREVRDSTDD